ncbi:MAG: SAM-dependent methyltransferase [Candidatus Dojkabacteria bacterium]
MQQKWEKYYQANNYFHLDAHESLEQFVNKCDQLDYSKILDLGCGAGADMLFLAEKGFEVVGVDFSPSAAANAEDLLQSKGLEGKVYVDNLFDSITNFTPEEFQGVIAINSLEYTSLEIFKSSLEQVADLLVPKGLFLLVVPSGQTEINPDFKEQLFFDEEDLSELVSGKFNILDFSQDKNNCYSLLLQKKF